MNGDNNNLDKEEKMFGAIDIEITLVGNVEKKVIYVTGVLIYTIDTYLIFEI